MHEMSLTEGIIRILEDHAKSQAFTRVKTLWVEIGALSTVDPDALGFCFEAVRASSPVAAGAVMEIIRVPGQAFCMDCVQTVPIAQRFDACPSCGGNKLQVTGGGEMRIKELEVE